MNNQTMQPNSSAQADPAGMPGVVGQARQLAWDGQHAQAITLLDQALSIPQDSRQAVTLLALRCESHLAHGRLDLAAQDAAEALRLASELQQPDLAALALSSQALVAMRSGDLQFAIHTAGAALAAARQSGLPASEAQALLVLGETQVRAQSYAAALDSSQTAMELFQKLDDPVGMGRACWVVALTYSRQNRVEEALNAARAALELCRESGDQYGMGNALNILSLSSVDLADNIQFAQQAALAFESAGNVERRSIALANMALAYAKLGLYQSANRFNAEALSANRKIGAKINILYILQNMAAVENQLGRPQIAQAYLDEVRTLLLASSDPLQETLVNAYQGEVDLLEDRPAAAVAHFSAALQIAEKANLSNTAVLLSLLGEAQLATGNPQAALQTTTLAATQHAGQGYAKPYGFTAQEIWWRHAQALAANQQPEQARAALDRAYDLLMEEISQIHDEGLWRNFLNKSAIHRQIVRAWLQAHPGPGTPPHLAIVPSLSQPFQRLVDQGLRLNVLRTAAEIRSFIVEATTELGGGERVLLILEQEGERQAAEMMLPPGEQPGDLLPSLAAELDTVRRTRTPRLALVQAAQECDCLSWIIAPLIAQNRLMGYLYTDLSAAYGRFSESDRDLLGLLASQAAVALANARWAEELEQKVTERTLDLQASNARLAQRNVELATINMVSKKLAGALDVGALVRLIGEQVRMVFQADIVYVALVDEAAQMIEFPYTYGEQASPIPIGQGPTAQIIRSGKPLLTRKTGELERLHPSPLSGRPAASYLGVPIFDRGKVAGVISVQSLERENAFTPGDEHLLHTLAAYVSAALQNARLFDEAQVARAVAESANHSKDEFLASMSHELRTPLTGILGLSEVLLLQAYGPLTEKQLKAVKNIESSGRHLLDLINDILDLTKIEAGKVELQFAPCPVGEICQASLQLVKGMAHKKKHQVGFNMAPASLTVRADARRLKQMLVNLLSNAIKFTPENGQLGLDVSADEPGGWAYFRVWDKGIGIAPEHMGKLFRPFTQIDSDLARQNTGTGLGLSLVHRMAEAHGGQIKVESAPGEGSTFTIVLPLIQNEPAPAAPVASETMLPASVEPSETSIPAGLVMMADDNEQILNMVGDFLKSRGYQVVTTSSGFELLEQAPRLHPQILLVDIQMPGMDGIETMRRVRAHHDPLLRGVPIIAVTALAMTGDREKCLEAGANDYMSKPIALTQLADRIRTLLEQRR